MITPEKFKDEVTRLVCHYIGAVMETQLLARSLNALFEVTVNSNFDYTLDKIRMVCTNTENTLILLQQCVVYKQENKDMLMLPNYKFCKMWQPYTEIQSTLH